MKLQEDFKLNVVPLIDVMLVLLVIVLCAASFIEYGKIEVNLPKDALGSKEFPEDRAEILLNIDNQILFNEETVDIDKLKELLQQLPKDKFILFKGDERAEFGKFVDILQILKELGLANFLIMTEVKK
ncbi:biopolymer transporter ExbD [Campylobacter sp. CCUG 57310]|uniref:biopolymer transporter ExbD n=1 Tax=Campylobacter sp. CCUG 57310 TaxID=2517362 RepID=UPI0015659F9F|nr:biopolymer transporter ExbD [Campylobacter sp. CCUG 57310]QKF91766.1 TonB system transport protein ExbD [Campylobacter sp. CCUG 57310]